MNKALRSTWRKAQLPSDIIAKYTEAARGLGYDRFYVGRDSGSICHNNVCGYMAGPGEPGVEVFPNDWRNISLPNEKASNLAHSDHLPVTVVLERVEDTGAAEEEGPEAKRMKRTEEQDAEYSEPPAPIEQTRKRGRECCGMPCQPL